MRLAALGTALWAGVITATVNVNRVNIIFYPMIVFAAMGVLSYMNAVKHSEQ